MLLSLVEKIFVGIGGEIGLSACLTAERFTGADQLQVIEAAGDAAIAVRVECVQRDAGAAMNNAKSDFSEN